MDLDSPKVSGQKQIFLALLIFYVLKELLYVGIIPLWQGGDEYAHFSVVQEIALTGKYPEYHTKISREIQESVSAAGFHEIERGGAASPVKTGSWLQDRAGRTEPGDIRNWQGQQHPLYYTLMAGLYRLFAFLDLPEQVYLLRLTSVFFGAIAVWAAARGASLLFPSDWFVRNSVPVLVATLPTFSYLCAVVTNDPLTVCLAMLLFADLVLFWRAPKLITSARIGFIVGLGVLARLNFAVLAPLVALVFILRFLKTDETGRLVRLLKHGFLGGGAATAVCGIWFVRNKLTYGYFTGNWGAFMADAKPALGIDTNFLEFLTSRGPLSGYPYTVFTTFWAGLGWGHFQAGANLQRTFQKICMLAILGLLIFVIGRRWRSQAGKDSVIFLAALGIGTSAAILLIAREIYFVCVSEGRMMAAWGRYYYPLLFPMLLMVALGIRQFVPKRYLKWAFATFASFFVAIDLFVIFGITTKHFAWGFSNWW